MGTYNKVIMVGKVVQEPELRSTASGKVLLRIRLSSRNPANKSGGKLFVDVYAFGKLAEYLSDKLVKGNNVLVDGSIAYREWISSDGSKRSKYEIWADSIKFLESVNQQEQTLVTDLLGNDLSTDFEDDDLPPF